jgi:acetyltransferase-like isoleucine patch superfamily enzyme
MEEQRTAADDGNDAASRGGASSVVRDGDAPSDLTSDVSPDALVSASRRLGVSASLQTHRRTSRVRLAARALVALLPSVLKRPCYRWFFGYRVGKRVRIGLTLLDARECVIEDDVVIGHLNVVIGVGRLIMRDHARVGFLNVLRGGDEIALGRYSEIIRMNEINSIPEPEVVNRIDPRFHLGAGSVVTAGHKIDFTDRVEIGRRTILGGRNSSLWTHNRQRTRPILIGELSYIGSEIRVAPGGVIPSRCIVGIGSVVTGRIEGENQLIAGVPARPVKPLGEDAQFLIEHRTRPDLPDDV